MKKYDLSQIMTRAWQLYRKGVAAFAKCLHRAWMAAKAAPINAQRIEKSRQAFGVTEEVHTWSDWRKLGFEVIHGSRCLFQCRGAGTDRLRRHGRGFPAGKHPPLPRPDR